ncbi:MAG: lactate racemase domain-containing protein [Actinobacteria bacterium]|nr:lactate racemase domain-containing protein [Actinomycetota bacterium]
MSAGPWVFCGAARLLVPRADAFEPPALLARVDDVDRAVQRALADPLAAPRLRQLARGAATVAVTIPDASRPCPSPAVLELLVEELGEAGVPDDGITVVIGCGLHRTTSVAERAALAGRPLAGRVRIEDAQGLETTCVDLGLTSGGGPVQIARRVAAADLAVTVGVVEPHLYAGFSGGVKGVAIGCAGHETIAWTHRPAFVSAAGVAVGSLTGNPFHEALREIAARTPLAWAVNVVVNERGEAAALAAGEPTAVQASLAEEYIHAWLRAVDEPFDIILAGVHAPKSHNFYQASRAATYIGLAAGPALADGGLLVVCADLPGGAGDGPGERNFADVLAAASSPAELVARGLREPLGPGGQRAFMMARVLERFRLAVVGAVDPDFLEPFGVAAFDSVDAAVAAAEAQLGRRARVLAVADAMATVVSRG